MEAALCRACNGRVVVISQIEGPGPQIGECTVCHECGAKVRRIEDRSFVPMTEEEFNNLDAHQKYALSILEKVVEVSKNPQ